MGTKLNFTLLGIALLADPFYGLKWVIETADESLSPSRKKKYEVVEKGRPKPNRRSYKEPNEFFEIRYKKGTNEFAFVYQDMNQNDSFDPKKVYYRMTTPWKNTLERGQIDTNHVPSIEYIVGEAYQKFDSLVYSTNNVPLEK